MREWEIAQNPGWSALVGTVKPPRTAIHSFQRRAASAPRQFAAPDTSRRWIALLFETADDLNCPTILSFDPLGGIS